MATTGDTLALGFGIAAATALFAGGLFAIFLVATGRVKLAPGERWAVVIAAMSLLSLIAMGLAR